MSIKIPENFVAPLDRFVLEKSEDSKNWYISGYASVPTIDSENEKILAEGIDFTDFVEHGYFNWDHSHKPEDIIALPIAKGCKIDKSGFFVTGKLLNTPSAQRVIELWEALKAEGRNLLGMSVEGKILKRNELNPNIIEKAEIKWVAITPRAVNRDTVKSFQIFAKSLIPELADENKEPLITQDLESDLKIQTYSVKYKKPSNIETEILVPDLFTWAVVELMLNNGLNKKEAEIIAKKFESIIQPLNLKGGKR